jgi:CxxC motif-containing protein (DUF1111 family)
MRRSIASISSIAVTCTIAGLAVAQSGSRGDSAPSIKAPPPHTAPLGHRNKLRHDPALPHPDPNGGPALGNPVDGLSAADLVLFADGRIEFESIETIEGGLGPIFNDDSCAACHSSPVSGGVSGTTVTRFGKITNGHFDPMTAQGGTLLQAKAIDPAVQEIVPADATIRTLRLTTPLFGAGLIEAIPDATIVANAATRQPDGVHGRAAMISDITTGQTRVGRFGWKAQQATLLAFAGDAYLNEMGVTNRFFPIENAPNGNVALLALYDLVPDIEDVADPLTGRSDIDASSTFMRLLAPPPTTQTSRSAEAGRRVFQQLNCDACHLPSMATGHSATPALANKVAFLYSDLLLHDMGALGDGIEQAAAGQRDFRTSPLWGLKSRGPFLHDGRATTVADAIRAHDGEARAARNRFVGLSPSDTQALLDFLDAL